MIFGCVNCAGYHGDVTLTDVQGGSKMLSVLLSYAESYISLSSCVEN